MYVNITGEFPAQAEANFGANNNIKINTFFMLN